MKFPYIVRNNTIIEYTPSDATNNLKSEVNRHVTAENFTWDDEFVPTLVTICVRAISKNFVNQQLLNELPCRDKDHLLEILSTDLPLELVVPLIEDEIYWKRRYIAKFGVITQRKHPSWTWKCLFLERFMQETVEQAQPQHNDEDNMGDLTKLLCPYIHRLLVTQLQMWKPPLHWDPEEIPEFYPIDHISLEPILKELTNIEEIDIVYGMRKVGDEFTWHMFKVSIDDCRRLGRAVLVLENLRVLKLHQSSLEDSHAQALMQGLIKNTTLIELDLSHCRIGDQGALCIAKVLTVHPTLEKLVLADNLIRGIGGEGIGFALLEATCCPLVHLDMRLNPLEHKGTMGLLRSLVRGDKPQELSLAGCLFEDETATRIGQMININKSLQVLDVSNNWFGKEGGVGVVYGMNINRTLKWLDMRETDITTDQLLAIRKYLKRNRCGEEEEEEEEEVEEEEVEEEEIEEVEEGVTELEETQNETESAVVA